jgi:uncharacterized protein (DUF302 family)
MRTAPALAAALLISIIAAPSLAGAPGTRVISTQYSFGDLVARLDKAIEASGMFAVTRASASAGARRRGVRIAGNMVVGVYRNDFAVRMLEASLEAGIEAPIRFYVTENPDGMSSLRYRTPTAVFAPYGDGAKLKALAQELDTIFAKIAAQATGK